MSDLAYTEALAAAVRRSRGVSWPKLAASFTALVALAIMLSERFDRPLLPVRLIEIAALTYLLGCEGQQVRRHLGVL